MRLIVGPRHVPGLLVHRWKEVPVRRYYRSDLDAQIVKPKVILCRSASLAHSSNPARNLFVPTTPGIPVQSLLLDSQIQATLA